MSSQHLSTNTFGLAKWIVSSDATLGTHTTIQSAINAASAGDTVWIREGTYTENLTLVAGVNLAAFGNGPSGGGGLGVTISGNATFSTAGTVSITGIQLSTNGAAVITVSGSVATNINLVECVIEALNTAISFSSSSASSQVIISNCFANINTTGITLYSMSSPGILYINYSVIANAGATTTASSNSAGSVKMYYSSINIPISTSLTGTFLSEYCQFTPGNNTAITTAGTGSGNDIDGNFITGTASAISIGTGTTFTLQGSTVLSSSNTNAITGLGTLKSGLIHFLSTSSTINTTTFTGNAFSISSAVKANSSGQINYPLQPYFLYLLETNDTNATGNGGTYTLGGSHALTKIVDQASNMTTGGTFTAPISGNYLLTFAAEIINCTIGTFMLMRIVTTKRNYFTGNQRPAGSASFYVNLSIIANMSTGDTATYTLVGTGEAGNTQTVNSSGGSSTGDQFTYVSGHLLS